MQVIELNVEDLKPYPNNPRENDEAVEVVMKSIEEFGFQNPIIVDKDYEIIAGHTRWRASKRLGLETVPVIIADDLSDEQVKAFRIMDNKASEMAEWDYAKLLAEFETLEELDYDTDLTGFDLIDIEKIKLELDFGEDEDIFGNEEPDGDTPDDEQETRNFVIQYNIIFNDEYEQAQWHEYLKALKEQYPDHETISERIIADITDRGMIEE